MGVSVAPQTVIVTTVTTVATIIFGTIFYKKWKKTKVPNSNWEKVGQVQKLHLYPLKSGRRIWLNTAEVTFVGMQQVKDGNKLQLRDRCLAVYREKDGEFRTARNYPKMIKMEVRAHDENHLAIEAPNMDILIVKIPNKRQDRLVHVKWYDEKIQGIDCGDQAAKWLARYIPEESGLRLAYHDLTLQRRDLTKTERHRSFTAYYKNFRSSSAGLFSNLTSLSILTQPSFDDLSSRIESDNVVIEQFRHNIIVDGQELQPFDEDNWDWVKIGDVVMRNVKDTTRCILTTVHPESGEKNPRREPLRTLEQYRKHDGPQTTPRFGLHLEVIRTGCINVNDSVYVVRK